MYKYRMILKTVAACIIIYILLKLSIKYISPFLVGALFSMITEPVIKVFTDRLHLKRSLSIIVALLLFCCLFFLLMYTVISYGYREVVVILKNAPYIYDQVNAIIQKYIVFLRSNFNIVISSGDISSFNIDKIITGMISSLYGIKDSLIKVLYYLPDVLIYITFCIFTAYFISRDRSLILKTAKKIFPEGLVRVCSVLYHSIVGIGKTECILVAVSTLQTIIGFLMLGVDYAFLLGIICGILDILPFIGPGIIFIPWSIYCLITGKYVFSVSLICLMLIVSITRQVLETRFISGKLHIHPLIILLSLYIGVRFFGVLGAIIGPITALILKQIYIENVS